MSQCSQYSYYKSGLHLWRNVIWHAQQEAQGRMTALPGRWTLKDRVREQGRLKRLAIRWLTSDSRSLRLVFEWADLAVTYREFIAMNRRRFNGSTT